jgi:long-chain acyl-CoA synthetase
MSYLAITYMGAVAVPILPDFSEEEVDNVLNHSEAKAILVSQGLRHKVSCQKCKGLQFRIALEDFSLIDVGIEVTFNPATHSETEFNVSEDDLAAIIYTSGTTGSSKGVMLSHKNLFSNVISCSKVQHLDTSDRMLSILPLSHTYENTVGFLLPLHRGSSVYYLDKLPTPTVLLPALKKVRPTLMLSVPLIIDKIYRRRILPTFTKNRFISSLYRIPFIRKRLNILAGRKLMQMFGGELRFFGIGGAKLDKDVEQFLGEARFPYAIGYGLTETSPLLAGVNPQTTRLESTGPAVYSVELKINDPDPKTGEGEIWARGPNVMKGYFKEQALTREVLTEDGWFKTGDLGLLDKDNYLFIKGRLKSMIVGLSGENIYPEEIESLINSYRFVSESLIVDRKGKLVALVHFNREELEEKAQHLKEEVSQYVERRIEELREEVRSYVNSRVNKFSQIKIVIAHHEPFKKTATQKIKRFLYQ